MCHSVHGGGGVGFPACITGHMTRRSASGVSAYKGGGGGGGQTLPPVLRDTVNKREVRILLECVLVSSRDFILEQYIDT